MTALKAAWSSLAGSVGAGFTGLCCLGAPAALGVLSAAGLGFLINDLILLPLLAVLLFATLWGVHRVGRRHGRRGPEWLAYAGSAVMVLGIFTGSSLVGYAGVVGLVGASIWNIALAARSPAAAGPVGRSTS